MLHRHGLAATCSVRPRLCVWQCCPTCCGTTSDALRPVSREALRYVRHLQRSGWAEAARADPPGPVRAEMEALLSYYMTYLLERRLNSPRFLDEIRQGGLTPGAGGG